MTIQNAVSHEEGLADLWAVRRAFWKDRAAYEAKVRANLFSPEATRQRHGDTTPHPELLNPDSWVDEYYFLNQPGQVDIQWDQFYDYQMHLEVLTRPGIPPSTVAPGYDPQYLVAAAMTGSNNFCHRCFVICRGYRAIFTPCCDQFHCGGEYPGA